MKSGRKLFNRLVLAKDREAALRDIGEGDLRSLMIYCDRKPAAGTEYGEAVLVMAAAEVLRRFMAAKGEGKVL
jgi:hypothetical protein